MLRRLAVRDLALVERATLELGPGLCVLTGETGAGKSLLVAALAAVCGGRTASDLVRKGAEVATIEAAFDEEAVATAAPLLEELGLDLDVGDAAAADELILRRQVRRDGRSRAWVNDQLVTLATLRALGTLLLDLHGQHEHQLLLDEARHSELLDSASGLTPLGDRLRWARARLRAARTAVEAAASERARLAGIAEELRELVNEVEAVAPSDGEVEALKAERETLRHCDKIMDVLRTAGQLLAEEEGSALERVGIVEGLVRNLEDLDPWFVPARGQLLEARLLLEEVVRAAEQRLAAFDRDPDRIMVVEDRLAALERLVRRHGGLAEARQAAAAAKRDLVRLAAADQGPLLLEELREAIRKLAGAADQLSAQRTKAARRLSRAVAAELGVLGFPGGAFEVNLVPIEPRKQPADTPLDEETTAAVAGLISAAPGELPPPEGWPVLDRLTAAELVIHADRLLELVGEGGRERVRFLIAPNPGEGMNPLGRTAAGGELARIMLALRTALSGGGGAQVLVFDEVDSGVGGVVLDAVGDRLRRLAEGRQVLSVTHQPRIAARAHLHLRVDKETRGGRTVTRLVRLDREARKSELERLLAGRRPGPRAAALAEELLDHHAPKSTTPSGHRGRPRPASRRAGARATRSPSLSDSSSG